jgi:hypothetical protein
MFAYLNTHGVHRVTACTGCVSNKSEYRLMNWKKQLHDDNWVIPITRMGNLDSTLALSVAFYKGVVYAVEED